MQDTSENLTHTTKAAIEDALFGASSDPLGAQVAANLIVAALLPDSPNTGAVYYRLKSAHWLALLIAEEPKMSFDALVTRVTALTQVSEGVRIALGGICVRLMMLQRDTTPRTQGNC